LILKHIIDSMYFLCVEFSDFYVNQSVAGQTIPHLLFYRNVSLSLIVHIMYTCYTQLFYWLPNFRKIYYCLINY
jgi:hypothetical protein